MFGRDSYFHIYQVICIGFASSQLIGYKHNSTTKTKLHFIWQHWETSQHIDRESVNTKTLMRR